MNLAVVVVKWSAYSPSTLTIPGQDPTDAYSFCVEFVFERNENKQKDAGVGKFKKLSFEPAKQLKYISFMFNAQLTSYRNNFSKVIPIFEGINSLETCLFLKFVPKSQFSTFRPQKGSFLKNFLRKFKRKRKMNKSVRRSFRLFHFCSQCYKTFLNGPTRAYF